MGRKFVALTKEELWEKIEKAGSYNNEFEIGILLNKLEKDIKVEFDAENYEIHGSPDECNGFKTLSNGLTYWGMSAGGDWECGVYFIVYWDGKRLRAYIPTEGNTFNRTTKKAYGNDSEDDFDDWVKRNPNKDWSQLDREDFQVDDDFDMKLIEEDILKRFSPANNEIELFWTSLVGKTIVGINDDSTNCVHLLFSDNTEISIDTEYVAFGIYTPVLLHTKDYETEIKYRKD